MVKTLLKNQKAGGLGTCLVCSIGDVGPTKFVQIMILPRLTLTYLTPRSNLLPNAFKWDFFRKVYVFKTVEAKVIILT